MRAPLVARNEGKHVKRKSYDLKKEKKKQQQKKGASRVQPEIICTKGRRLDHCARMPIVFQVGKCLDLKQFSVKFCR